MNCESQYVHEVVTASTREESTSPWMLTSKSAFARLSRSITFSPFSKAAAAFRSATPRAIWYAARNPNQIAIWRMKSPQPRGRMRPR